MCKAYLFHARVGTAMHATERSRDVNHSKALLLYLWLKHNVCKIVVTNAALHMRKKKKVKQVSGGTWSHY